MNYTICKISLASAIICFAGCTGKTAPEATELGCTNPVIWADVPDMSMMRVGDTYYMSSTTMHMNPGVPIMKSKDLSNWEIVSYAYDILGNQDETMLINGKNTYGKGSWASCIRYVGGKFFVSTFDQVTAKTYIFTTDNIESGKWERHEFEPSCHDHTIVFEDDGHVYMINGNGKISIREIEPDFSGIKPESEQVLIENAGLPAGENLMLGAEGSQMFKINGKYYLFNICWPRGGVRTVICHRADSLFGPYEGRVVLQDKGIAQGGLIDTPDGKWYAYLFGDRGAVGRIPYIVPVTWENEWPVLGVNGQVPDTLDLPKSKGLIPGIVDSDEFDGDRPKIVWQWNHNPVNDLWSLTERKGFLRLRTDRTDTLFTQSRNMLTQRTFGPKCTGSISLDASNMKDGDVAGLALLAGKFGFAAISCENGKKSIVMVNNLPEGDATPSWPPKRGVQHVVESVPTDANVVYFKADCDFSRVADESAIGSHGIDKAVFFYSLDGTTWTSIGDTLQMSYSLDHFMGQRYALFNYSTKEPGGYADFDWYRTSYTE
ncbi:MAG: glycoside hydrolase 43 family protein [Bacteroidales bacterium]|nr:glycoside hydrolase 43 family protein [Bacteroidales bacterium]